MEGRPSVEIGTGTPLRRTRPKLEQLSIWISFTSHFWEVVVQMAGFD